MKPFEGPSSVLRNTGPVLVVDSGKLAIPKWLWPIALIIVLSALVDYIGMVL